MLCMYVCTSFWLVFFFYFARSVFFFSFASLSDDAIQLRYFYKLATEREKKMREKQHLEVVNGRNIVNASKKSSVSLSPSMLLLLLLLLPLHPRYILHYSAKIFVCFDFSSSYLFSVVFFFCSRWLVGWLVGWIG